MPLLLATTLAYADPPQPKIVVLDRRAIMSFTKAGQDIAKQMQAYSNEEKWNEHLTYTARQGTHTRVRRIRKSQAGEKRSHDCRDACVLSK